MLDLKNQDCKKQYDIMENKILDIINKCADEQFDKLST